MQKCKKCSNKFEYKAIFKSIWKNYSPITCEGCNTQYHVNFSIRIIHAFLISLPLIIRYFFYDMFINTFSSLFCYLVYITVVLLVFPFFAKYHTKDK